LIGPLYALNALVLLPLARFTAWRFSPRIGLLLLASVATFGGRRDTQSASGEEILRSLDSLPVDDGRRPVLLLALDGESGEHRQLLP
jgi:hypothetical protein